MGDERYIGHVDAVVCDRPVRIYAITDKDGRTLDSDTNPVLLLLRHRETWDNLLVWPYSSS